MSGCARYDNCVACDDLHLSLCLGVLRQLIVKDPYTGYEGSFEGFLRQYPKFLTILNEAEKRLGKKKNEIFTIAL